MIEMDVTEVDMVGEFAEQSSSASGSSSEQRIVHFDLKGAPPKMSYYEWLFPLLKKWGATGLLVEYEDMFPYQDSLSDLRLNYAYSPQDIHLLQSLAAHNGLAFIPLVQTFGHFEFVLKHDKFRGLREVEQCPMTLCPSMEESFTLLKEMLGQVIEAHNDLKYFHIGADEVYHIGFCPKCLEKMELHSMTQVDLFLGHIKRLLTYLKKAYPKVQIIMWDDMFRKISPAALKESGIGNLVQPMIWYYQMVIDLPIELWTTYSEVFSALWVASAFKGATGPRTYATEIAYHIENHKDWLKVVKECIKNLDCTFMGYALTGWQRYDHYAVLCELFPVSLPSLAICLLTMTHGAFTVEVHHIASKDLNFKGLIHMNPYTSYTEEITCNFRGSEIFVGVHQLIQITFEYEMFLRNERMIGWMTDWHVKKNYTNPAHLNHIIFLAQQQLSNLEHLSRVMETSLSEVFFTDTVEEWIGVYISPMISKVKEVLDSANKQLELGGRPREHLCPA